ncbi:MAG TPA: uridine kinase [Gemmataceae bacterium]|nr:uridine kinase [Gemmataceae bacterium]
MSALPVLVIGICGASASGKTTFTKKILEAVEPGTVAHIPHDAYYHAPEAIPAPLRDARNFDHPDTLDTALLVSHLQDLRAGRTVEMPVYDFATHRRKDETVRIEPRPVVIVEGILVFADARLRALMDIKVFVETPDDVRILRRLRRDISERGRTLETVIEQYLATVRPMHKEFVELSRQHADVIVPGEVHNEAAVDLLVTKVRAWVEELRQRSALLTEHQRGK